MIIVTNSVAEVGGVVNHNGELHSRCAQTCIQRISGVVKDFGNVYHLGAYMYRFEGLVVIRTKYVRVRDNVILMFLCISCNNYS